MNTPETNTEVPLHGPPEATERLLEETREGQRLAHQMLARQSRQLDETLEQNRARRTSADSP
jgi:hypothetical protein